METATSDLYSSCSLRLVKDKHFISTTSCADNDENDDNDFISTTSSAANDDDDVVDVVVQFNSRRQDDDKDGPKRLSKTTIWVFLKTVYIRNKENVTDLHRLF